MTFATGMINTASGGSGSSEYTVSLTGNWLYYLGVWSASIAPIVFAIALATNKITSYPVKLGLAIAAFVLSAVGVIGLLFYFNVITICFGFLFLWQPTIELIGAIMMLVGARKTRA